MSLGCQAASPRSLTITNAIAHAGFELAPGQTAIIPGAPAVTFISVTNDGRCPRDRECEASLPVVVRLRIGSADPVELSIFDRDQGEPKFQGIRSIAPYGVETLRLRDVKPWPSGDHPPRPDQYRIEVIVERKAAPRDAGTAVP